MPCTFYILDANVLVAFIDEQDTCHEKSIELLGWLTSLSQPHRIVIPRNCIAEIVIVLRSKGLDAANAEEALRRFMDQPYVVTLDISEMQIHKFAGPVQKRVDGAKLVRTSDYLVGVLARVLDGVVLTFDKGFAKICTFCECITIDSETNVEELV